MRFPYKPVLDRSHVTVVFSFNSFLPCVQHERSVCIKSLSLLCFLQQWRLIPYQASAMALINFSYWLSSQYVSMLVAGAMGSPNVRIHVQFSHHFHVMAFSLT